MKIYTQTMVIDLSSIKKKKYGITCERRFEFDESDKVIGFVSKGCF